MTQSTAVSVHEVPPGDNLEFCFNPNDLYFFDSESQRSLVDREISEPGQHLIVDTRDIHSLKKDNLTT